VDVRYIVSEILRENSRAMKTSTTLVMFALVLSASTVRAQRKLALGPDGQVLGDFKMRVEKYDQLRKKADDSAPPLKESGSAAKIKDGQQGLAERIGAARVGVKQGDIFTPEIAAAFKRLLRPEAKQHETKEAMKEDKPVKRTIRRNSRCRTSRCWTRG